MDKSNALLPIVGEFPPEYRSIAEFCVYFSPYDWEQARERYTAYELLVEAARKCVASFNVRYRAIPPDVELDPTILEEWRAEMKAADEVAILALRDAIKAVEEAG